MKVLEINNYHYMKGGVESVYLNTISLLEKKGHEVIPFSVLDDNNLSSQWSVYFPKQPDYNSKNLLKKIRSIPLFFYSRDSKIKLTKLIKDEQPDIAHLHIFYGRITSSILKVLKKFNIPVVMTVHEYRMLCPTYLFLDPVGEICEKCANRKYYWCILKKCNKGNLFYSTISAFESYFRDLFFAYEQHIDRFMMPSNFILQKHIEYRNKIGEKSVLVNNFVEYERFDPNFLPGNYYLYYGRLSSEKGILTLLKVFREFPDIAFKIVGTGEQEFELKDYVKKKNMKNVEMHGYLSGDELHNMIKNARFIIIPSECYENYPMVVLESFALGKPVIGADIGGISELVEHEVTGLLFSSGDKISLADILKYSMELSSSEVEKMGKNARSLVETNFSAEIYYKKLFNIFNKVILENSGIKNDSPD